MSLLRPRIAAVLLLAATMAVAGVTGVWAHEGHQHDGATPSASPLVEPDPGLSTGVAYLTIRNDGDEPDRLLGATTEMAVAVEIHETREENNVGTMRLVEGGLAIPAGESVAFAPGGYHLMLVGLSESLLPGTTYELTLVFERTGEVVITVPVQREAPEGDEADGEVTVGDLTISAAWSRPAPKLDGDATSVATPTPVHEHTRERPPLPHAA